MRGKEQDQRHRRLHPGITPACAGKSRPITWATSWRRDHPRMCGEKRDCSQCVVTHLGSPPHVRGKVMALLGTFGPVRITPACAGKRASAPNTRPLSRDHPRMCGEKCCVSNVFIPEKGSPPHVRGKEYLGGGRYHVNRITPACAGKSAA